MAQGMNDKDVRCYLSAFADGELDVEQNLRVLEHMTMNPTATRRVMHQQQLRQAVSRCLCREVPPPTAALRQRVAALTEQLPQADAAGTAPRRSALAVIGRWFPAAVAAMLFLAALIAYHAPSANSSSHALAMASLTLPAPELAAIAQQHTDCVKDPKHLMDSGRFPHTLRALPGSVADYVGARPVDTLDLSSLGYRFVAAGECTAPGDHSVHMVYEPIPGSGHSEGISLWLRSYRGQPNLVPDKLYVATGTQTHDQLLVWRHHNMVYYLCGHGRDQAMAAARVIRTGG